MMQRYRVALAVFALLAAITGCRRGDSTGPVLTVPQLQYRVLERYPDFFWSDPDLWPIARPGAEEQNARAQFDETRANADEFAAILEHLGLPEIAGYTDEEKLLVYREHKLLRAVPLTPFGDAYSFAVRTGEGQGLLIEGTITTDGRIREVRRTSSFNTHPICLPAGVRIDTPDGPLPVKDLRVGMPVWTFDVDGNRAAGLVRQTTEVWSPAPVYAVRVTLSDGRAVTASPGHPTAEGRSLGSHAVGDALDGASIVEVQDVLNRSGLTYDLLPSGETGLYIADGVVLGSTLWREAGQAIQK